MAALHFSETEGLPLEESLLNGSTRNVQNIVFTGLMVTSFVLSVPGFILTIFIYCTSTTVAATTRHTEQLFLLASLLLSLITFVDSFQWVFLIGSDETACKVVGAFHQYVTGMAVVFGGCVGTHLIIVTKRLKCLMVIDELKRRRYRRLLFAFIFSTFLLPLLSLPWPRYGPYDYKCWLIVDSGPNNTYFVERVVLEAVVMHIWGVLISVFIIAAVLYAYVTLYCRSSRFTRHVCAVSCGMMGIPIITVLNVTEYVCLAALHLDAEQLEKLFYVSAIWTPLQFILAGLALLTRSSVIIHSARIRRRRYVLIKGSGHSAENKSGKSDVARVLPQCSTGTSDASEG